MKRLFILIFLVILTINYPASAPDLDGTIIWSDTIVPYDNSSSLNNTAEARYLLSLNIQTSELTYIPFNGYIIKGGEPGEFFYCIREEYDGYNHHIPMLNPDFGFGPTTYSGISPDIKFNSFTLCEGKFDNNSNSIVITDIKYYENDSSIMYVIGYIDDILYYYDIYEKIVALYPDGTIKEYEWKPYTEYVDRIEIHDGKIYNPVFSESDLKRIEGYDNSNVLFLTETSDEYLFENNWYINSDLTSEDTPSIIVECADSTFYSIDLNINIDYNIVRYFDVEISDSSLYLYAMSSDKKLHLFIYDFETDTIDNVLVDQTSTVWSDNHMEVLPDQNMILCYYAGPYDGDDPMYRFPIIYLVEISTGETYTLMEGTDFIIDNIGQIEFSGTKEITMLFHE